MRRSDNPFTPSPGHVPEIMAGNADLLNAFPRALESKRRTPLLSMIMEGINGSGKTCLLASLSQLATEAGWAVSNISCLPGLENEAFDQALESASTILGNDAPLAQPSRASSTWRSKMSSLLRALKNKDSGLLLTVDDIAANELELIHLVSTYQHFIRERLRISLVFAGEPNEVAQLLRKPETSFLHRAEIVKLGNLSFSEVEGFFRNVIRSNGRTIGANALREAVEASGGQPYMMQLVGYHVWEQNLDDPRISLADCKAGIAIAQRVFSDRMLEPLYQTLSDGDIKFLLTMIDNDGPVKTSDIAKQMGVSTSYAGQYKNRLASKGVIEEKRRGYLSVAIPGFQDYLRSNSVDCQRSQNGVSAFSN